LWLSPPVALGAGPPRFDVRVDVRLLPFDDDFASIAVPRPDVHREETAGVPAPTRPAVTTRRVIASAVSFGWANACAKSARSMPDSVGPIIAIESGIVSPSRAGDQQPPGRTLHRRCAPEAVADILKRGEYRELALELVVGCGSPPSRE